MKDRLAVSPGRVLITPENGSPYYATMTRADNPTQEGTPLNKNSLLKDTTAALLGGNSNMVPDEALVALKNLIDGITPDQIGAAKLLAGSRSGTGSTTFSISAGFKPKAAIICGSVVSLYASGGSAAANVSGIAVWVDGVGEVALCKAITTAGDGSVTFVANKGNLTCTCGKYSGLNDTGINYFYAIWG